MNTRSSTEAELVAVDDVIAQILWTLRFLLAQGYPVEANVLFQDNNSAIKLERMEEPLLGRDPGTWILSTFM